MFDIGFSEILLVFLIGLIVLGPERLPVAVRTVMGWIRALRSLASNVQQELAQELKLQEFQDSLKKVEEVSKGAMPSELRASMDALRKSANSMQRTYREALQPSNDHPLNNASLSTQTYLREAAATLEATAEVAPNTKSVSGRTPAQITPITSAPTRIKILDNQLEQAAFLVSTKKETH